MSITTAYYNLRGYMRYENHYNIKLLIYENDNMLSKIHITTSLLQPLSLIEN